MYGRDIDINLGALLKGLSDMEGDFGILIDSLGPNEFMDMFDDIANVYESGKNLKLCLPLQHVNTRVLSSMNRTYDVNNFKECLRVLTAAIPDLTISTHLMVGYPGETEEEFEELTEFVRWLMELNPMNEIKHVQFTPNPGTAAAKMDNQVPRRMGAWRRRKMRRIALQHALKVRRENDSKLKQVSAGQ